MADSTQPIAGSLNPRPARRFWTPASMVIGVPIVLTVVVFAIFAALCVQGYRTTLEQAHAKAESAVAIISDEMSWFLGGAHVALQQIAGTAAAPADIAQTQVRQLEDALQTMPGVGKLGLYDATGNTWGDANPPELPANVADTDFFKELEAGKSFTISRQRAGTASRRPIFVLAQRLGQQQFGGAVVLAISGDLLQRLWTPQNLGIESTASLIREDGWLVGRYPELPDSMDLSKAPPFTALAEQDAGIYDSPRSPADGVARIVAFRRLPGLGVMALASVSQDAALTPLWNSIIIVSWLLVPIAVMLLGFALVTARMLRNSERTNSRLAAALAHNDVLFREIHHRVKNNLQSVASLLQMQPIAREIKTNMGQRIAAMSAVHEHIYRSNSFSTVLAKPYVETLVENIRAGADPKVRVVEQLDEVSVDKDAATPLGLILNEVVANAFKHAFPDGREGTITVQLTRTEEGRGRMVVEDDGIGFDPATPAKGIGQRLIRALTEQLGGTSGFEARAGGGTRFQLTFPLSRDTT